MKLRAYWRFFVVCFRFLPLIVAYLRDRRRYIVVGSSRDVSSEQRRERATKLLESLITLGPTFIKLGQLLSTRPDILPPEYIAEFSRLQDDVPPADWEKAEAVLEAELGAVDEEFDNFETEPISGASLGQVYRAEIDGEPVAVKVRRPSVETLVEADLRVIRWLLPLIRRFVAESRSFSLETLADEFAKTIRQEMDYNREGRMLREIRTNFEETDAVQMPTVVESHSSERVLTMEYIEGTKIDNLDELDAAHHDRSELAETLQETYLQMIIQDGVFHADPHPGNLAVADDGTLIFYDFGMSGYVDPFVQDRIVDFYSAVARQDIDAILDTLIEMGTLSPEADRDVMAGVMEIAIEDARGEDIEQYRIQQIMQQVEDTIYEFPLRLPSNLALVLRVATVVEGVCVTLDPDFDFISVATEYLRDQGFIEEGAREFAQDRATEVRDAATASIRVPPKLESTLDRMQRDDLQVDVEIADDNEYFAQLARRMVYGLLFSAGIISMTLLYIFESRPITAIAAVPTLLVGIVLYWSFRTQRGVRAQPKFTRQRMRERQERGTDATGFGDVLHQDGPDDGKPGGDGAAARTDGVAGQPGSEDTDGDPAVTEVAISESGAEPQTDGPKENAASDPDERPPSNSDERLDSDQ